MDILKRILLIALFTIVLAACNLPGTEPVVTQEDQSAKITGVVQTVYAQLTETAMAIQLLATETFTVTPEPTFTDTPPPTFTPTVVIPTNTLEPSPTEGPTNTPTSDMPCLRANLETKSVPDGSVIFIDRVFTQTFRIKNTGSCTWDSAFELRFAGGDLLNAGANIPMTTGTIPTWGYANVDVLMRAPSEPGTYRGYWSIKSNDGQIFGVGPKYESFWVEIKAVDPDA